MSDKQTNRCAASGAHQFGRYALTCCENGSEGNGGRSDADISLLRDFVLRNDLADEKPLQHLLCRVFPDPVKVCFSSDEYGAKNPADFVWLIDRVQIHWRYAHTGPKTDVTSSRPENGCRTIRAKVLRRHSIVGNAFFVDVEGQEVLVIDLFGLNPNPGEFVYFHQRVICEVEQQSEPSIEVDDDSDIQIESVPSTPFNSNSGDFELPDHPGEDQPSSGRSLVDEGGDGDVEIGVPATVLPPISEKPCDCGHECKGGHPCPRAPIMIQTGGPDNGPKNEVLGVPFDP